MSRGKIWTITDGFHKLPLCFLNPASVRHLDTEQIVGLPKFRFKLEGCCKRFNRPCLQTQRREANRLVKIIRRPLRLKFSGVLIIGRCLIQIPLVLFQKSQIDVCFHIVWIRPERPSEISKCLICFLLVFQDLPQPVQRRHIIALNGERTRKIFRRFVNFPLRNQQLAGNVI